MLKAVKLTKRIGPWEPISTKTKTKINNKLLCYEQSSSLYGWKTKKRRHLRVFCENKKLEEPREVNDRRESVH